MYCISGGTSCRLTGGSSYKSLSFWGCEEKIATSGFGLKVILEGSLSVSGPCILQLSFGDISKIA